MIYDKYVKESPEIKNIDSNLDLVQSILRTQSELLNATNNYNFVDEDLVDYYSYQIIATKSKLDHLIQTAKNKGLAIDRIHQLKIRLNTDSQVS